MSGSGGLEPSPGTLATSELFALLRGWVEAGALRPLDWALTRFLADQGQEQDVSVLLAVALTSERNGHGHVCLDLSAAMADPSSLLGRPREDQEHHAGILTQLTERLRAFSLEQWTARLRASPLIDIDEGVSPLVLGGTAQRPLLYLRRYWRYEHRIRAGIRDRLERSLTVDAASLHHQLEVLFPPHDSTGRPDPDWQRLACALAARSPFFIITGGPGTGKTTTVVRLLALLQALAQVQGARPLRIELAAPTGKAAARLSESINAQVGGLADPSAAEGAVPVQVKTLHRLLGTIPNSRHFRHHAAKPLPADVVVVDEASMVDVEMMARLLEALRPEARLILIGDKDQLSSVEAGAVLGDLCQRAAQAHYQPATADWLRRVSGQTIPDTFIDHQGSALDQAIVMLRKSFRFDDQGGIGALAAHINESPTQAEHAGQRLDEVMALFMREAQSSSGASGSIQAIGLRDIQDAPFARLILEAYDAEQSYLRVMRDQAPPVGQTLTQCELDAWARKILDAQKNFHLLTPLRQGPWGVEGLNQRIIQLLRERGHLDQAAGLRPSSWFPGRPVLVTRNDYGLDLMNGDIGITLAVPLADGPPTEVIVETPAHGSDVWVNRAARTAQETDTSTRMPPRSDSTGSLSKKHAKADALPAQSLRVAFPAVNGGVRWVLPSRLLSVETVFAMTVHKSQGSEFNHAALILPDKPNPTLTRELLYTAVTRAKQRFTLLYAEESVLAQTLARRVQRVSGLHSLGLATPPPLGSDEG